MITHQQYSDVCVVGAGIVGLAHAWAATEAGYSVTVFEQDCRASGASVRNFGMVWPIGVAGTPLHQVALRSREIWLEVASDAHFWCSPCGSVHLALAEDELAVIREYAELVDAADCNVIDPSETRMRCPIANAKNLIGALWSPSELAVDPREATPAIARYLAESRGVRFLAGESVRDVREEYLRTSSGDVWHFRHAAVCTNVEIDALFPELFRQSGLQRCKLQMQRTAALEFKGRVCAHAAGGLTLRHYRTFEKCPSIHALRDRISREMPSFDRYGIHVLASLNAAGEITIGDSHEFDAAITPFDSSEINSLILEEAHRLFDLREARIAEQWHGVYVRHPSVALFEARPLQTVSVHANANGLGMTLSFGAAEKFWRHDVLGSPRYREEAQLENVQCL